MLKGKKAHETTLLTTLGTGSWSLLNHCIEEETNCLEHVKLRLRLLEAAYFRPVKLRLLCLLEAADLRSVRLRLVCMLEAANLKDMGLRLACLLKAPCLWHMSLVGPIYVFKKQCLFLYFNLQEDVALN